MSSIFEPTLSLSRPPPTPSLADQLPNINFGFDELRERMAKFTVRFDTFIEQGRKRVLEERNQFRINVAEMEETARLKKKDIEILQLKSASEKQTLDKEAAETREMHAAVTALEQQRDKQQRARDDLCDQIAVTQREIDAKLTVQRTRAQVREAQARFNVPELDFWVAHLCLSIEGTGHSDRLRFVYTHIDERDWERAAWFDLCTGARDYDVKHCRPRLERDKVEKVLDRTNETRDLSIMLKGMRDLFVAAMKTKGAHGGL